MSHIKHGEPVAVAAGTEIDIGRLTYQIREAMAAVTKMLVDSDIANMAVPQCTIVCGTGCGKNHCETAPYPVTVSQFQSKDDEVDIGGRTQFAHNEHHQEGRYPGSLTPNNV